MFAIVFGIIAALFHVLVVVGLLDSVFDSPRGESGLSTVLFWGFFWPAVLTGKFFPQMDGFLPDVFGWAIVGFGIGTIWSLALRHGTRFV